MPLPTKWFSKEKQNRNQLAEWGMKTAYRLNFSEFQTEGGYYLKLGETRSPNFRIHADVYEGTADFLLNYMRQQRCGYNPFLKDSCHLHDGIIVDHPTRSGEFIDVTGGWHDATDYLQYSTTSINTIFQMMFAYKNYPEFWGDFYDASGNEGANGIPDILDEIKWGLQWMLKMNPAPDEMYNQIADDRDHIGFRLPVNDPADYGLGKYRPVYFVTGKPQGLAKFKNTSTGVSSIAGKFASGFALAAELFNESDPELAELMKQKATRCLEFALSDTGYTQTACNVSPYYYEERNYADDLQLAATQLYRLTGEKNYLKEAEYWGHQEPCKSVDKNDTAGHYESYPFVNLGHYFMMQNNEEEFAGFYEKGLQVFTTGGKTIPFLTDCLFFGVRTTWWPRPLHRPNFIANKPETLICRNGSRTARLAFWLQSVGNSHDLRASRSGRFAHVAAFVLYSFWEEPLRVAWLTAPLMQRGIKIKLELHCKTQMNMLLLIMAKRFIMTILAIMPPMNLPWTAQPASVFTSLRWKMTAKMERASETGT
jgi:hypothetical protein